MVQAPRPGRSAATAQVDAQPRPSHRSVTEWTRQRLYDYLLEGQWVPGHVVHEVQLTEELGVSRSPVRDALAELEREGLLARAGQGGRRYVIAFEPADIEELYDLRASLECLAVRYVVPQLSGELLDHLAQLLREMQTVQPGSGGRGRSFAADFEYHELIVHATGRARLYEMLRRTWLQTRVMLADLNRRGIYPPSLEEIDRVTHEHRLVYDALRLRDVEAAVEALGAHIMGAKKRVLSAIESADTARERG